MTNNTQAKRSGWGGKRKGAGRKVDPDKMARISLAIRRDLLAALRTRRDTTGEAVNAMINDAIDRYLAHPEHSETDTTHDD